MQPLDLVLREHDTDREVWRGSLPPHAVERLVADAHVSGILAGVLPNDGLPVRLHRFGVVADAAGMLGVAVAAGDVVFRKVYRAAAALADDAEVRVMQLVRSHAVPSGTYRFACVASATDGAAAGSGLRLRPPPRTFPPLPEVNDAAATAACRHLAIVLPRRHAERLLAQARATSDVEVGALLVVTPYCLIGGDGSRRLAVRVEAATPLAHGTHGTAVALRVTPDALAAVPVDERAGQCRGGLCHSHPFGAETAPHFLSSDDKAVASWFFWLPFQVQLVLDPRSPDPEEAIAAFAWVDGALSRVCVGIPDA